MTGAAHPFRSGLAVDADKLSRARSFAHGAADNLSIAMVVRSDVDRDLNLDEAKAALDEAQRLLAEARTPEPPHIPPAAVQPFNRAAMVDALFDIATPLSMGAAR